MKEKIYILTYHIIKSLLTITPKKWISPISKYFSLFIYSIDKKHRSIAMTNLDLAYEDTLSQDKKIEVVKKTYLNLLLSLFDVIENQKTTREKILEKVSFKNEEILEKAINKGQNIVLMTAHYGNWELIPLAISARFAPLSVVGRKLDSEKMDSLLKENREQFDIDVIEKSGAMRNMIKSIKKKRILGLLVDQNISDGILVNFFGKPVKHTHSISVLARKFDITIIPVFITRENNYLLTFYKPLEYSITNNKEKDILELTQKQADITEEIIRKKPEEWFWLHKRWKDQFKEKYEV